ncbi:MAG: hypothetical protein WC498_02785 [Candidatus Saccharimonadales bacterium]
MVLWWRVQDQRYGWLWRATNLVAAALIFVSIAIPVLTEIFQSSQYKLSADTIKLTGQTDEALLGKLQYDPKSQTYQFNKDAVKTYDPVAALKNQVGGGSKKSDSLYALDVPQDIKKGVTYHDINTQLGFSLVPEFDGMNGKMQQGHVVFPINGAQAVYTLKNNGLKEDIIVTKTASNTMSFAYKLELPTTLEARVIPNSGGNIGIYSADPALFGDISFGSSKDQAAIEKARENGAKSHLVFGLPAPVIKVADGNSIAGASARFELNGNRLSVIATGLSNLTAPFTIDPSVVITSTADFQTAGNNEDNIDFSTAGQINRVGLKGGVVNTIAADTSCAVAATWCSVQTGASGYNGSGGARGNATLAYNGFLYSIGGNYNNNTNSINTVSYAALNSSTGTVGAWTVGSTLVGTTALSHFGSAVYNGYLYVIAGMTQGGNGTSSIQYALICTGSNSGIGGCSSTAGSVGTWTASTTSTNFGTVDSVAQRGVFSAVAYNGYMYAFGGLNVGTSAFLSDVLYAPIYGNGDLGSWSTTTSMPTAGSTVVAVSNGYVYVGLSCDLGNKLTLPSGCTATTTLQIGTIASNGSISGWVSGGPTFSVFGSSATSSAGIVAANGYLYVAGGQGYLATVSYAPIYASGSVGTVYTTSPFTAGRAQFGMATYNGYLYEVGGSLTSTTVASDTQYAKVDQAGTASVYTTSANTFTTAVRGHQTIAYNGFLYVMGGDNAGAPVTTIYGAAINADGSIGAFTTTGMTALPSARTFFGAAAYEGYMFIVGGCIVNYGGGTCTTVTNELADVYSAPINSNGTIGTWTAQTSISSARFGHSVVAYNGYLYSLGGVNTAAFQNDVQYHAIGASGAISGAWTTSAQTLPAAQAMFGAAVNGGVLYVAGGCTVAPTTCTTTVATVAYASIGTAGDLSGAFTSTTAFTTARSNLGMVIVNGYMYITGGRTNATLYNDTQFAPINTNGSVGTWATSAVSTLSSARWGFGVAAYNSNIYVTGGRTASYANDVQYAQVNNGGPGNVGVGWTSMITPFTTARAFHATVAYNNFIYVIAGYNGAPLSDIQYAPINGGGSIGTWASTTSLPAARYAFAAFAYNGYMYEVGGYDGASAYNTVQYALICTGNNSGYGGCGATAGTLGTWVTNATTFAGGGRFYLGSTTYNGYIYVVGGATGVSNNDVQYAKINGDGSIGSWATTTSFTTARYALTTVAFNGYLYMMGGYDNVSYYKDVQYAPINSNGTVGTWVATTNMPATRAYSSTSVYNGFMYIDGGYNGTYLNDVQYAPINSNGAIGTWTPTTVLTSARMYPGSLVYDGFLYALGGATSGGYITATQYVPLNSITRVGHYSKLIDLGSQQNVTSITYNGVPLGVGGSIYYKTAGSSGVFGSSNLANTIGGGGGCYGNTQNTRYVLISITLDDSLGGGTGGSFPDTNGTNANVTDFTVLYYPTHPQPNIRLRAGQTLQTGILSPLDTCGP